MMHAFCDSVGHSIAMDTKGWVILLEDDDFVEIKFVFLHTRDAAPTDHQKATRGYCPNLNLKKRNNFSHDHPFSLLL